MTVFALYENVSSNLVGIFSSELAARAWVAADSESIAGTQLTFETDFHVIPYQLDAPQ